MATQGERLAKLEQWKEDLVLVLEELTTKLSHIDDTLTNGLCGDIKEVSGKLDRHLKVCETQTLKKEKKKDWILYGIRAIMIVVGAQAALFFMALLYGLFSGTFKHIAAALEKIM